MLQSILIKNGRIWNGESFHYGDVLVENGIIASIETNIKEKANFIYDATGKIVSPGLIDIHTHLRGISGNQIGVSAEAGCFPFGVTAAVDAYGTDGDKQLLEFFQVKSKVFALLRMRDNHIDFSQVEQVLEKYGDKALGIKIIFNRLFAGHTTLLKEICSYAHNRKLKVMVHASNDSPAPMWEILSTLHPGDILTHVYHGGINTACDDHFASLKSAQKNGIIIDAGLAGNSHTDFSVLKTAMENEAFPNTISSDTTNASLCIRGGNYGLPMCMSIMRHCGMSEADIFRAVTTSAAAAVDFQAPFGKLNPGQTAYIAVMEYGQEGFDLCDRFGNHIQSPYGYRCHLTIADGMVVYRR